MLGHIPLSTLSRTDISKWVTKLRVDGASGKTITNQNHTAQRGLVSAAEAAAPLGISTSTLQNWDQKGA
jgi:hypothetical protein